MSTQGSRPHAHAEEGAVPLWRACVCPGCCVGILFVLSASFGPVVDIRALRMALHVCMHAETSHRSEPGGPVLLLPIASSAFLAGRRAGRRLPQAPGEGGGRQARGGHGAHGRHHGHGCLRLDLYSGPQPCHPSVPLPWPCCLLRMHSDVRAPGQHASSMSSRMRSRAAGCAGAAAAGRRWPVA